MRHSLAAAPSVVAAWPTFTVLEKRLRELTDSYVPTPCARCRPGLVRWRGTARIGLVVRGLVRTWLACLWLTFMHPPSSTPSFLDMTCRGSNRASDAVAKAGKPHAAHVQTLSSIHRVTLFSQPAPQRSVSQPLTPTTFLSPDGAKP